MGSQLTMLLPIEHVGFFLSPILFLVVWNDDSLSAKVLSVRYLGHKGAPAALQQQDESFLFAEVLHFLVCEIFPFQWITSLSIFLKRTDNLTNPLRAFLVSAVAYIGQLALDFSVIGEQSFQLSWIYNVEPCLCHVCEHGHASC